MSLQTSRDLRGLWERGQNAALADARAARGQPNGGLTFRIEGIEPEMREVNLENYH